MNREHKPYLRVTSRSRLQKSINSLLGLLDGIAIDGVINPAEICFFQEWANDHADVQLLHPFNELIPVVADAIADGVLTEEEMKNITWLCRRLCTDEFYDQVTSDIQRLHAVVGGIISDGKITEKELKGLSTWLEDHDHLRTCWPFDEIDSLVTAVMSDGVITEDEHAMLMSFFSEFINICEDRTITNPKISAEGTIKGVCALCPEIEFKGAKFVFTGASPRYSRFELSETVKQLGGRVISNVSPQVNYLIIGAGGNPCWAYACYGRKVEKAVELRKSGARLLIVHENDFHDAVLDQG
jgi:NAD-dependent DNA ligase